MVVLKSSSRGHLGSDLELDTVSKDLLWILDSSLIDIPALVLSVVTVPEDDMSSVNVFTSMDIKALSTIVSDVSALSSVPLDSLGVVTREWSESGSDIDLEALTSLVGKSVLSLVESSDGLGSLIEGEPLLLVIWVEVLDSESILVSTNVLSRVKSSVLIHSGSDLELDSGSQWLLWILNGFLVNPPSLVGTVMALVPDQVSVMVVMTTMDIKASISNISQVLSLSCEPSDSLNLFFLELSDGSSVEPVSPV